MVRWKLSEIISGGLKNNKNNIERIGRLAAFIYCGTRNEVPDDVVPHMRDISPLAFSYASVISAILVLFEWFSFHHLPKTKKKKVPQYWTNYLLYLSPLCGHALSNNLPHFYFGAIV